MISPKRQQQIYTEAFCFIQEHKVQYIPLDVPSLCRDCGVDLVPLSQIVSGTGLSAAEIFSIWGNKDGSITAYGKKHRIAFNDSACRGRTRFTICEELGHVICGHTRDPAFNIFHQDYSENVYAEYDEEARIVAGFLVCHPKFFYAHEKLLEPEVLASVCGLTLSCAQTRHDVLTKFRTDIKNNFHYKRLSLPRAVGGMRKYERLWLNSHRGAEQTAHPLVI